MTTPKQVAEMEGAELDYAVALAEGLNAKLDTCRDGSRECWIDLDKGFAHHYMFHPSDSWSEAGPIIEREGIDLEAPGLANDQWEAYIRNDQAGSWSKFDGPTPLIAAMRCYVASKAPAVSPQEEE